MTKPTISDLMDGLAISKSYASEILSDSRTPSRGLAIAIYRKIGWRHELIADLTEQQMTMLEELEPWKPRQAA